MKKLSEKNISTIFAVGVVLKGLEAVIELTLGFVLLFVSPVHLSAWSADLVQDWFAEDLRGFGLRYAQRVLTMLTPQGQHFAALYFITHGAVKAVLVYGLLRKHLWAYPVTIGFFSLFVIYQLYHLSHIYSISLLLGTIVDIAFIALVAHQYKKALHPQK